MRLWIDGQPAQRQRYPGLLACQLICVNCRCSKCRCNTTLLIRVPTIVSVSVSGSSRVRYHVSCYYIASCLSMSCPNRRRERRLVNRSPKVSHRPAVDEMGFRVSSPGGHLSRFNLSVSSTGRPFAWNKPEPGPRDDISWSLGTGKSQHLFHDFSMIFQAVGLPHEQSVLKFLALDGYLREFRCPFSFHFRNIPVQKFTVHVQHVVSPSTTKSPNRCERWSTNKGNRKLGGP
ncbi:unnamed protein product [Cyclocybe aegerita]|uniref:Uncharacterized protein n=1 Tax=Cyclocybe aegerita TaxID=1973307 RepID=A0A8S0XY47_CYCAE|nr:unnamed protein product [Cyclocybe aegerita]